jgi:heptose I phosphotransferase
MPRNRPYFSVANSLKADMLWLDDELRRQVPPGREFDFVFALTGEVFREQKNRRMIRTRLGERTCFVKTHGRASWRELLKNAARGRWPVLTAEPEWDAIRRVRELGIPTVKAIGFGVRGRFPAGRESFIITEELAGFIHVSDLPGMLAQLPRGQRTRLHRALIADIARIARRLHARGLNHRDFYLNHFMLPQRNWLAWNGEDLDVRVIDLHRTQIRRRTPRRAIAKDISGLLFSAFDADLTSRDWLRFLSVYWNEPWRERWRGTRWWRWNVMRRAVSLYRSERGRSPRLPGAPASCA